MNIRRGIINPAADFYYDYSTNRSLIFSNSALNQ